ncbi:LuxR family transcriptional regulator [Streptosporangium sp. NPDC051022]|uniref:helix-turn-helix transcriptional regulator n=1 Tax=Streptosporangium sp. NPDC051022 TaxID=3155752 RepID=UPI0034282C35
MRDARLLGRDGELAALRALIDGLPQTGGSLALRGGPGVGKSSLLRSAAEHARSAGKAVLTVTGVPGAAPYSGLRELLSPLRGTVESLPESQRALLGSVIGDGSRTAPQAFAAAMAAFHLLVVGASRRPLVLAVDDTQWLDHPSRQALGFIARRLGHDPIVLVAAVRATEISRMPELTLPVQDVPPLDDDSSRVLLGRHAPGLSVTARERILRTALGNPLALTELPQAWRDGGPSDSWTPPRVTAPLVRAFAGGLAELPPPVRDAVLVAAVDYVGELQDILRAAAVLTGGEVAVDVFDEAAAANLVHLDGTRLRFRHPVARAAVVWAEPPARLRAANQALAAVLVDEPHRCAWHRAQSVDGPDDESADELATVSPATLNRRGVAPVVWALELSARLTGDRTATGRRLLDAAQFAYGLGQSHVVHDLLDAATDAGLTAADRTRGEWLRDVSDEDTRPDTARVARLCATAKRARHDPGLALDLLLGAALRVQRTAPGSIAQAAVAATADELAAATPASIADPRHIAALALAEPVLRNREVADRLPGTAAVADLPDAEGLRLLGLAAHSIGDPVRAVALLARAEPTLRDHGRVGPLAQVLILRMVDLCLLGDWGRAAQVTAEARLVLAETHQPSWADALTAAEAVAAGLRGETERALKLAARADGSRRFDLVAGVRLARGLAWLAAERHDRAYEELEPLFDKPAEGLGREAFAAVMPFAAAAAAAVDGRRLAPARAALAKLEHVAALAPAPLLHVQLPYARAVLADDADAEDLYAAALGQDLARWPLVRVGTQLAYSRWLHRNRRQAEARTVATAARTTLDLLGAPIWAEHDGTAVKERSAEDVLTSRELRIARLAASGLSNREIGARIHLSAKTVGSYLSGMFPKLGVTSRGQLASRLEPPAGNAGGPAVPRSIRGVHRHLVH